MKKLLFSVLLLLTMAFGAVAQTEVTIGDGSDSYHAYPVNMFYNYSLTQQIYTADEIGMSGTITSICFYYDYSEDFNSPDINMYMMTTTKSAFNGYDDVVAVNDASLVYSGDFVGSEPGWITINLDNEFYYNDTDNLLICIYDSVYGYPGPDFTFKYSQTSDYTVLSFYSDSQVPDLGNLSSFSDNMEANMCHSNIKLVFETEENPTYRITVEVGENGTVLYNDALVSDYVTVSEGDTPEFVITPATNYQIDVLSLDGNAIDLTSVQLGGYTYTFEPVMANHTISVTFKAITYTITASAGENGYITPNGAVEVTIGDDQTFTITADDNYHILSVVVDEADVTAAVVENNGEYTFTNVTENHTIAATFEADPVITYTITGTVIGGHGTMTPDGSVAVNAGDTYEVVFSPEEFYALDTVKDNGFIKFPVEGTGYIFDNVYTLTNVSEDHEIIVKYKDTRPYYNIHVEVETAGGDATPRDTTVVAGSDVTINVTPNEGYHISRLEIDGNMLNNCETDEISFRNVQADHNIKIAFYPNSIEENTISSLNVYPNPNNGMFSIDFSNIEGEATYQLIDARGVVIENREINVTNGEIKNFNYNLRAGAYFVRIINGDKVYVEQIVFE